MLKRSYSLHKLFWDAYMSLCCINRLTVEKSVLGGDRLHRGMSATVLCYTSCICPALRYLEEQKQIVTVNCVYNFLANFQLEIVKVQYLFSWRNFCFL